MGPEYIMYFNDKTIDVSVTLQTVLKCSCLNACKYLLMIYSFECLVVLQASDTWVFKYLYGIL